MKLVARGAPHRFGPGGHDLVIEQPEPAAPRPVDGLDEQRHAAEPTARPSEVETRGTERAAEPRRRGRYF